MKIEKNYKSFDYANAVARLDGDDELFKELSVVFLDNVESQLKDIEKSLNEYDAEAIRTTVHTFKGSISLLETKRLFNMILVLEQLGMENKLEEAKGKYDDILSEINMLCNELKTL